MGSFAAVVVVVAAAALLTDAVVEAFASLPFFAVGASV